MQLLDIEMFRDAKTVDSLTKLAHQQSGLGITITQPACAIGADDIKQSNQGEKYRACGRIKAMINQITRQMHTQKDHLKTTDKTVCPTAKMLREALISAFSPKPHSTQLKFA